MLVFSSIPHTFVPGFGISGNLKEDPTKFKVHVGTVNFDHTYVGGGTVWRYEPFQVPRTNTQVRDLSIQDDPEQFENVTPAACRNVQSAIENCVGVVTTIIDLGFDNAGISTRYPGNDGRGVDRIELMPSQGVGNIIKGPYIRNCTNFVPKSIGMRMDGFDAELVMRFQTVFRAPLTLTPSLNSIPQVLVVQSLTELTSSLYLSSPSAVMRLSFVTLVLNLTLLTPTAPSDA